MDLIAKKNIIYVPLLNEGTPVIRPTYGIMLDRGAYRLLPIENYNPEDEKWAFSQEQLLNVRKR